MQSASLPPHPSTLYAAATPPHAVTPSWSPSMPPQAQDPVLAAWARARGADLSAGDPRVFFAWQPFVFLPRIERVLRQARLAVGGVQLIIGEVTVDEPLRKATGEDRMVVALVATPRARWRVALRAKKVVGLAGGMAAGLKLLDDLSGASRAASMLGDPHFEKHYDVTSPNPTEAQYGLPIAARQVLMALGFVGTIELRVGGFALAPADAKTLEPTSLDRLLDLAARLAAAL